MMRLSQFITLVLTLSLQGSLVLAGSSSSTGSGSGLNRRVVIVDPATNVDFKAISGTEPKCKTPCKGLINLSNCASTDFDCTYKALCTVPGLDALVTCNNCILQVANQTTGVTTALYSNVTAISQETSKKCGEISQPATPTVKVISWSAFYPHGNGTAGGTGTTGSSSTATATDRSGIAAAASAEAARSGAGRSLVLSTGPSVGLAGLVGLFLAFA